MVQWTFSYFLCKGIICSVLWLAFRIAVCWYFWWFYIFRGRSILFLISSFVFRLSNIFFGKALASNITLILSSCVTCIISLVSVFLSSSSSLSCKFVVFCFLLSVLWHSFLICLLDFLFLFLLLLWAVFFFFRIYSLLWACTCFGLPLYLGLTYAKEFGFFFCHNLKAFFKLTVPVFSNR